MKKLTECLLVLALISGCPAIVSADAGNFEDGTNGSAHPEWPADGARSPLLIEDTADGGQNYTPGGGKSLEIANGCGSVYTFTEAQTATLSIWFYDGDPDPGPDDVEIGIRDDSGNELVMSLWRGYSNDEYYFAYETRGSVTGYDISSNKRNGVGEWIEFRFEYTMAGYQLRINNWTSPVHTGMANIRYIIVNGRGDRIAGTVTPDVFYVDDITIGDQSLPVILSSFTAIPSDGQVTLMWATECEVDNRGFYIYRSLSEEGPYSRINAGIIPGAGSSAFRNEYTYIDRGLENGVTYYYKLEDIDYQGNKTFHNNIAISCTPIPKLLPEDMALLQNYPNPFNPATTITYQVVEPCQVVLSVFNSLGCEIRRLVDERKTPDIYSVRWNGQDNLGQKMATGIYIYQLKAGDFSRSKKMILLR